MCINTNMLRKSATKYSISKILFKRKLFRLLVTILCVGQNLELDTNTNQIFSTIDEKCHLLMCYFICVSFVFLIYVFLLCFLYMCSFLDFQLRKSTSKKEFSTVSKRIFFGSRGLTSTILDTSYNNQIGIYMDLQYFGCNEPFS